METSSNNYTHSRQMKKYAFGIIIMIAGLLLLGYNTGLISYEWKHIFFSWQMLLIAIGVINLMNRDNWVPGVILISIGSFFILPRLFFLPDNFTHLFWPLILITAGVVILVKRLPGHRGWPHAGRTNAMDEGYVRQDNIFSGSKRRISSEAFKGGQINCIFGGAEIDLTQSKLAEGIYDLEVNAIFGGVTVIVPSDWKIELKMTSILGGFTDKRAYIKENPDPTRVLVIRGSAIFGGGEIKSY
jgi:predicted membrane protein